MTYMFLKNDEKHQMVCCYHHWGRRLERIVVRTIITLRALEG